MIPQVKYKFKGIHDNKSHNFLTILNKLFYDEKFTL